MAEITIVVTHEDVHASVLCFHIHIPTKVD